MPVDPAPDRRSPRQPSTDADTPADLPVSVVIPARDSAATLADAVQAVVTQRPAPVEVVIAVGPSRDDTAEVAARLAEEHPGLVRTVPNPSGRTPEALNIAIAATSGPVVARVDAHCVLPTGYLAAALATLHRSGAGNVGAVQRPVAGSGFARAVAAAMGSPLGTGGASYRAGQEAGPVDTAYLGVFRREALEAVGGYDPTFVRNQDAELNLRLARAGYPVWLEPRMVVAYRPRGSVRALARQYLGYGRWRRRTGRTHPGSLRPRQLIPPVVVVALGLSAVLSTALRDARPVALAGGGYLGVLTGAALRAADGPRDVPGVALALGTMHTSWGVGFLLGPPSEGATTAPAAAVALVPGSPAHAGHDRPPGAVPGPRP